MVWDKFLSAVVVVHGTVLVFLRLVEMRDGDFQILEGVCDFLVEC